MRYPDWKPRLIAWLASVARQPFVMGQHDCALFAAGAVQAMTGDDYATAFRGRYRTMAGGLRILRKAGFADHIALAQSVLQDVHVSRAAPGDLAVVPTTEGEALGVVQGEAVYVLMPSGLGMISTALATRVLRVT